jgi:PPOX class probable F420-dependent enzyme
VSSKSTATKENALSNEERDAYLARLLMGRMATQRPDGWAHVTPIWYLWEPENGVFRHTLGAGRKHLRHLRQNPKVTLCIDEDLRLDGGLEAGAWAITVRGHAELSRDEDLIRDVTERALVRYLGPDAAAYTEPIMAEGRTIVTVTPHEWVTWDYRKGDD